MPSHRRVRHSGSAARLPLNRLPLGTPLAGSSTSRPTSQLTNHSDSSRRGASSDFEASSDIDSSRKFKTTFTDQTDTSAMSTAGDSHLTTAEDKLRRQQERIQLAEAALAVPTHVTHAARPQSRAKGKTKWNPVDIGWDIGEQPQHDAEISQPVSQVRVNTYSAFEPPLIRSDSLSRSMSSASAHTGPDGERHDSMLDTSGFQTYHRGRLVAADGLKPYEGQPEEKQKTVEATFDKRAMHEVFGADLPSLDYMNSMVGASTGQLQFAQHPNGDVSAHIWSHERYGWENIGSFSNIRKKIEGQLARDHLKGETAPQRLRRNTLAYFRAIAKQREYSIRGMEFGQAEIHQLLPTSDAVKVPSLGLPSESFSTVSDDGSEVTHLLDQSRSASTSQSQPRIHGVPAENISQPIPTGPRHPGVERFSFLQERKPSSRSDDPFTSTVSHSGSYSSAIPGNPKSASASASQSFSSQASGRFHGATIPAGITAPLFTNDLPSRPPPSNTPRRVSSQQPTVPAVPNILPFFIPKSEERKISSSSERRQLSFDSSDTPSRQKATTPLETREALRDSLFKLGESAKVRGKSQTDLASNLGRTVLFDPFQNQSSDSAGTDAHDSGHQSTWGSSEEHQPYTQARSSDEYPGTSKWNSEQTYPAQARREFSLADSVPDTEAPFSAAPGTVVNSVLTRASHIVASDPYDPRHSTADANWRDPDEELKEWWTSGNKFARQEDFYQSIKALAMNSTADTSTPSSRPRPIGAPPTNTPNRHPSTTNTQNPVPFNESTTRLLIPVYENLAAYVQGPPEQRRDYWCRWSQPPEWCIDRGPNGNNSFFDSAWQPPARVGRDPRYRPMPGELRFGGFTPGSPAGNGVSSRAMRSSNGRGGVPGLGGFGGGRY